MRFRLIIDENRGAAANMAVDEAIFRACARGEVPPTIRIYGWTGPSISIGKLQRLRPGQIDLDYCREAGVELVRRPTGGRAVLHGHDVTFSVAVRIGDLPSGAQSIRASHTWLMAGVVRAMRRLEIEADLGAPDGRTLRMDHGADCFAHVAECDVRVGESKLAGAAQARKWESLLEQGSLPHAEPLVDPARLFGAEAAPTTAAIPAARAAIVQALADGFAASMGITTVIDSLTDNEIECARDLEVNKYACPEYTFDLSSNFH
ncbi:MAG: lipoate--protein ligase family protein [Armatimonadota bacterium]